MKVHAETTIRSLSNNDGEGAENVTDFTFNFQKK